jgi:hypothetical protein
VQAADRRLLKLYRAGLPGPVPSDLSPRLVPVDVPARA